MNGQGKRGFYAYIGASSPRESRMDPAPEPTAAEHQEALLDEALDDTFPASDPVSMVQPRPHDRTD